MKLSTRLTTIAMLILAVFSTSCEQAKVPRSTNPYTGFWKSLGTYDSTGTITETSKNQTSYVGILEDGTFFMVGFRKDFPQTGVAPTTLEEYQKIAENSWGRIGKITVDGNKVHIKDTHNSNPQHIGREFTLNCKMAGDTLIEWFDNNNFVYKYLRVK